VKKGSRQFHISPAPSTHTTSDAGYFTCGLKTLQANPALACYAFFEINRTAERKELLFAFEDITDV